MQRPKTLARKFALPATEVSNKHSRLGTQLASTRMAISFIQTATVLLVLDSVHFGTTLKVKQVNKIAGQIRDSNVELVESA